MSAKPVILFVDDEPDVLDGIRDALCREPYTLLTATSADAALALLAKQAVDVVVSDERMPGVAGSELLARVCKDYPDTVRIILTGQASMEATIRAINEGQVYRYLTKPFASKDLAACVRDAVELRTSQSASSTKVHNGARGRQAAMHELESAHPGITQIERSQDGYIVLDDSEL